MNHEWDLWTRDDLRDRAKNDLERRAIEPGSKRVNGTVTVPVKSGSQGPGNERAKAKKRQTDRESVCALWRWHPKSEERDGGRERETAQEKGETESPEQSTGPL